MFIGVALELQPSQQMTSESTGLVFICSRNTDYPYAEVVYQFLVSAGLPVFFSRESLPELGISDYRKQIDRALDEAEHMIVVSSSVDNALSPWVEAEWGFFINEKRSGRKTGNLITIAVGGLQPAGLPPSLRYFEVIPYDPAGLDKVLRYVQQNRKQGPGSSKRNADAKSLTGLHEIAVFGESPRICAMAVSGSLVATGGFNGAVRLWDISTRRQLAVLFSNLFRRSNNEGMITALAFSPDAAYLASGHIDGAVHFWSIEDKKETEISLLKHEGAVGGLSFSPDNGTLTTCGKDGFLKIWNLQTLVQKHGRPRIHQKPAPLSGLLYTQKGEKLICSMSDRETGRCQLQVHKAAGSYPVLTTINLPDFHSTLAASQDGSVLAGGSPNGSIVLYDLRQSLEELDAGEKPRSLQVQRQMSGHRKGITSLSFLPNGKALAGTAAEGPPIIWDTHSGKEITRPRHEPEEAYVSVAFSDEGNRLIAALRDGRIRVWEFLTRQQA
ncbi:MAG: TIR domain-containing protein [Acidobacteria bacterium]|nr:TIR domain-containing protein [Acidobacteriota bacterium]